jgi:16S rRNA (cytosine967-C5)-methyltransferase
LGLSRAEPSSSSRQVALDLLDAVLGKRQALDATLAGHRGFAGLSPRDRAFARLLAVTALRRLGEIDAALKRHLSRPLPAGAARAMNALRLGAAQRLFLGTPPHAAVDTTVRLLDGRLSGFKGLANAVLRKLAPALEPADTARLNTPGWLWESWAAAYDDVAAAAIAAAHLAEPPLDLSVAKDADAWRDRLAATLLPTGSLRRPIGGDPSALPGYDEGAWWVQDAAAALPARLLGPVAGRRVIDLCAAPGGKTAQLAAAGAEVTAVDRSAARLARLEANLQRLRLSAHVVAADAETWRPEAPAEAVLLDAPCTATGTIRRHPDIARIKTRPDVAAMAAVQDRLLRAAVDMAAPGGRIVYATCSLQPEEGPERIAALLRDGAPVRLGRISATEMPGLSDAIASDGTVRTLPCHWREAGGIDGFFIARLLRV